MLPSWPSCQKEKEKNIYHMKIYYPYPCLILHWYRWIKHKNNHQKFQKVFRKVTETVYILWHNRCRLLHAIPLSSDRCQRRLIWKFQPLRVNGVDPELVSLTLSLQDCLFSFHASGPNMHMLYKVAICFKAEVNWFLTVLTIKMKYQSIKRTHGYLCIYVPGK